MLNDVYALWIKNTSESDPHSCEATEALPKKEETNSEVSTEFKPITSVIR